MTLYTIGYEGTDIGRFVETLKVVGVQVLVDVRAVALSRKKGFSKTALRERLTSEGVEYRHLVDLGDPKAGRIAARAGDLGTFRRVYAAQLATPAAQVSLSIVLDLARAQRTCLMCFERDPVTCHRSIVGRALEERGMTMLHLFGDSPSRYVRNAAKLPGHHFGESAAAA